MLNYRRRRLLLSSFKRAFRWEFWPVWFFYIPIVFYIVYLVLRYRSLAFTAVNPSMLASGIIGEHKSANLLKIQTNQPDLVATTLLISEKLSLSERQQLCMSFMQHHRLEYPVVLKPDSGQRGVGVAIIEQERELEHYLSTATADVILQPYIEGVEFGVFYMREPEKNEGEIFSLTRKCFPSIEGNGEYNLERLILDHPRLHYMADFLLKRYHYRLHEIPEKGEQVSVVRLGSHCQGSLFLEGKSYINNMLSKKIDLVSQQLQGFYFGRFDIRAPSIEALQKGDFKVIEVNGVTSESANMYDPQYNVLQAYKIMMTQWRLAFKIGQQNIARGHQASSIKTLWQQWRAMNRGVEAS